MGKSPKHPDWLQGLPRLYDSYTPQRTGDESSRLIIQPSTPLGGSREHSTLAKAELFTARQAPAKSFTSQVHAECKAFFLDTKLNLLMIAFPFAIISKLSGWNVGITFTFSMLALCPLAERLGFVTEQLAQYTNDTLGGLLNATFGNATEVIISGFALKAGYVRIVQLSLLGSVVSNLLLVMGSAFLAGGVNRPTQRFNVQGANVNSALLLLGTVAVLLPSLLSETGSEVKEDVSELALSRFESLFLLVLYICYLVFQLVTHRFLFEGDGEDDKPGSDNTITVVMKSGDANGGTLMPDMEVGGAGCGRLEESTVSPLPASVSGMTIHRNTSGRQLTSVEMVNRPGNSRSSSGRPVDGPSSRGNTGNNINIGDMAGVEDRPLREELVGASSTTQGIGKSDDSEKGKSDDEDEDELVLSKAGCFIWLTAVTILISLLSEWIVDGITGASKSLHIPMPFLVTIILPIVGNAAEHASAIVFAYKNRIEIALGVALGSSTQVAVLIVPFCVVLAWMMHQPLDLNFNSFEASVYFMSVLIAIITVQDGTANWLKGTLLLVTYFLVAAGFWWHKDPDLNDEEL